MNLTVKIILIMILLISFLGAIAESSKGGRISMSLICIGAMAAIIAAVKFL